MPAPVGAAVRAEGDRLHEAGLALAGDRLTVAQALYAEALEAAEDDSARAEALVGLGSVAYRFGDPLEAVGLLERAAGLRAGAFWEEPGLAETLGRAYADLGELDRARLVLEECRRQFERAGDRVNEVKFACLVGYALTDRGRFEEAEGAVAHALEVGEGIEDPLTRIRLSWAQARLRGEQGKPELAIEHARAALAILETTDETLFTGLACELLASLYNDLGRSADALTLLQRGWPLLADSASRLELATFRIEEARALVALDETERAVGIAFSAAAQLDGARPGDAGRAYVLLGEIFDAAGDLGCAHDMYAAGIARLEGLGPSRYLVSAYKRLGELFESEYRTKDALTAIRRALEVQRSMPIPHSPPEDASLLGATLAPDRAARDGADVDAPELRRA